MKIQSQNIRFPAAKLNSWAAAFALGTLAALSSLPATSSVEIAQAPLYIGSEVPGNLALVPSVEFPTIDSQANIGAYNNARDYMGYFDATKCYSYQYDKDEAKRHFYPVNVSASHDCSGEGLWSGNYLSWAATQTIDPFRLALTGGDRVEDVPGETWLQKARHDGQSAYSDRRVPASGDNSALVKQLTPASWSYLTVKIHGLGNKMNFTADGALGSKTVDYDPSKHKLNDKKSDRKEVYQVSMRVKVCVEGLLEDNCVKYSEGYKPEGLIQEYASKIRFSIFGYLNDTADFRDGGVMRARQKYVGPFTHYPEQGVVTNPAGEWDSLTGVIFRNPDPADAIATNASVIDSGVINYLNKFGRMTTAKPKGIDPVSELYYAAIRYFKNMGNVPEYSNMTGDSNKRYSLADGFPVITAWDDPIRYSCQVNAVLGIGDVNTHRDGNLPGSTYRSGDSTIPSLVTADKSVNVTTMTKKVFDLEGINKSASVEFTGRYNTAYIAGLAYDAHTRDLRPDDPDSPQTKGMQTVSTHWVDVRENQVLLGRAQNQYWLAAKYGGFKVPGGFNPDTHTAALPDALWTTTGELLSTGDKRPDNFYVASEADKMVQSLTTAFKNIIAEMRGSGSSFASNSTKLEAGAMTYQAQFYGGTWGGELTGYSADVGSGALTSVWSATSEFPLWGPLNSTVVDGERARKIFFRNGSSLGSFEAGQLGGTPLASVGSDEINYLRGDRSNEWPNGTLRARRSVLGDIVNSQPVYVGVPNSRLYLGQAFAGASIYPTFVGTAAERTPVVYVGANDGMLHAFNANTGAELFAFVPTGAMAKLTGDGGYSDPAYEHRYTVDGSLTAADVFTGGAWKTVLVGTLGRGGRGVFALDVTDPSSPALLWEKSETDIPALGNNLGQPIIAQVGDGDWRVLLGNGPNGSGDKAQLIMIGVSNGAVATVDTGVGANNGMAGINAWSSTDTGFVDTVYGGDLKGNMWKLTDLAGAGMATKLFAAGDTQPITATPLVAKNPATLETWVFFGTGRYLSSADVANKDVQTWYGIIDKGTLPVVKADLRSTTVLAEGLVSGVNSRALESYSAAGASGWYFDLVSPGGAGQRGERMVVSNFFQGLALIGTTRIPDSNDVCSPSGTGFTMAISPFTGGRLAQSFFDVNNDGKFDSGDTLNGVPVSGIGYDSSPNNPIFLGDTMYTGLDDGSSAVIKTNASAMNVRRVSWRELIKE